MLPTRADANDRATAQAARLLERARGNLFAQPTQAYRNAKASYAPRRTQTALQLMGHAACRMRDASKALHAHRRLRSKASSRARASNSASRSTDHGTLCALIPKPLLD